VTVQAMGYFWVGTSKLDDSEPTWQALYDVAASQEGLFTTRQAAAAGGLMPRRRFNVASTPTITHSFTARSVKNLRN